MIVYENGRRNAMTPQISHPDGAGTNDYANARGAAAVSMAWRNGFASRRAAMLAIGNFTRFQIC